MEKFMIEVPLFGSAYVLTLWDSYPPKMPITFHPVEGDEDKVIVEVLSKELYDVIAEEFKLRNDK